MKGLCNEVPQSWEGMQEHLSSRGARDQKELVPWYSTVGPPPLILRSRDGIPCLPSTCVCMCGWVRVYMCRVGQNRTCKKTTHLEISDRIRIRMNVDGFWPTVFLRRVYNLNRIYTVYGPYRIWRSRRLAHHWQRPNTLFEPIPRQPRRIKTYI